VRASGHGDHFGGCRGVRFGELYGVIGGFHGFEKLELLREFHPIMSCHCTAQHSEKRLQSDIPGFESFKYQQIPSIFNAAMIREEKRKPLTAKEAAEVGVKYLAELKNLAKYDISLEEIEVTDDKSCWLVTLGYPRSGGLDTEREFKIVKVDAQTGEVLSIKISSI
jgi:hypothetical protein